MKQIVFWLFLAAFLYFGGQWLGETVADQMVARAEVNLDNEEFDKALATLDRVDFLLDWTEAGERAVELRKKVDQKKREVEGYERRQERRDWEYEQDRRAAEDAEASREAEERNRPGG